MKAILLMLAAITVIAMVGCAPPVKPKKIEDLGSYNLLRRNGVAVCMFYLEPYNMVVVPLTMCDR